MSHPASDASGTAAISQGHGQDSDKVPASKTTQPLIDIYPQGDLTLVTKGMDFRVSSHVMQLASPFFEMLLKPAFREGVAFAEKRSAEIALPDDDGLHMAPIFKALHHKEELPRDASKNLTYGIAILIDKYDMTRLFTSWGHCQGKLFSEPFASNDERAHRQWVCFTLIFNDRAGFREATHNYLSDSIHTREELYHSHIAIVRGMRKTFGESCVHLP